MIYNIKLHSSPARSQHRKHGGSLLPSWSCFQTRAVPTPASGSKRDTFIPLDKPQGVCPNRHCGTFHGTGPLAHTLARASDLESMTTSAQFCQICAVSSQSQRQLSTYSPVAGSLWYSVGTQRALSGTHRPS